MITRKPAPQRVLEIAQYAGIIILLGLMLYANGKDLLSLFA
jgi:membrane-associated protease RseP (regulator of RpoE activity)